MNVPAKNVRERDVTEQVVLELAALQALRDAAQANAAALPNVAQIVQKLRETLERDEATVEIGAFLDEYDAAHGQG